jgi:hypothetical protein
MRVSQVTTARGTGFWGYGVYEIEASSRLTTYNDSTGQRERTVTRYELGFRRESHSDRRAFRSDSDREKFLNDNFARLDMREIPSSQQLPISPENPLEDIVGEYLSDVTFVMDYLQMNFCGSGFNFYIWPIVVLPVGKFEITQPGYRDALCGLIGNTVQHVDVYLDTGLTLTFKGGGIVTVSLRAPAESTLPEVATYSSRNQRGIIWSAGEEPFD